MGLVHFKTQEELDAEAHAAWRASVTISPFQARAALARAGLLAQVRQLINGKNQDSDEALAWQHAGYFRRDSPTILAMAAEMGLTESQLDDLFETGRQIDA